MLKRGKKASNYNLVIVAIVAIIGIVALFTIVNKVSNKGVSDSQNTAIELNLAKSLTGNVVAEVQNCIDSDGGKDYDEKGTATDARGQAQDICLDEKLVENFCDGKLFKHEIKDVPQNKLCIDGAAVTKKCVDTDVNNLDKYITVGSATDNFETKTDKCSPDNMRVAEAICEDGKATFQPLMNCPLGCENGACVDKCTDSDAVGDVTQKEQYKTKNSITYLSNDNGVLTSKTEFDKCKILSNGENKLMEMICQGNKGVESQKKCAEVGANMVCKDGACIPGCLETDANKKDSCLNSKTLEDFSCNAQKNGFISADKNCPNGCEIDNGQAKCINKCTDTDKIADRSYNDIINGEYSEYTEKTYISLYVPGTATGYKQSAGKVQAIPDSCSGNTLTESYCDIATNTVATKSTVCSQGCLNSGACKPEPVESKCEDSDIATTNDQIGSTTYDIAKNNYVNAKVGGIAKEYGTTGTIINTKTDECVLVNGVQKIKEYYCDLTTKKIKDTTYPCPTGKTCKMVSAKAVCS